MSKKIEECLEFKQYEFYDFPSWVISNNKFGMLGEIYLGFKDPNEGIRDNYYSFSSENGIFSANELRDIADFLDKVNV